MTFDALLIEVAKDLGLIVLVLIIIIVGSKTLIDALAIIGVTIPFIERRNRVIEQERVRLILAQSAQSIPRLMSFLRAEEIASKVPWQSDIETVFMEIVKRYTRYIGGKEVGVVTKTPLKYYVDLRDTVSNIDDDMKLATLMANFIKEEIRRAPDLDFQKIAVPETGHVSLAFYLAQLLGRACVRIRRGPLFTGEDRLHGKVQSGEKFILIDDVVTSGDYLAESVNYLRESGAIIGHVFVFIQRTDKGKHGQRLPADTLKEVGVTLHTLRSWSDDEIHSFMQ